jgi:uncharacterized membrane protein YuzA (DUF378 family)
LIIDRIALVLTIIGGLCLGSMGIFRFDPVAYLFSGSAATGSRVFYTLIGIASIWCVSLLFRERDVDVVERA